jgi:4a-hydroxytetrahydrobiopterin dehydratase
LPLFGWHRIESVEDLTKMKCKPCEGGVDPLTAEEVQELMPQLHDAWIYDQAAERIERKFSFPAYGRTMAFVNAIAWVATTEGHHPDLKVSYGSCDVQYQTHAINGLSINDFICAAKIDRLAEEQ